MIFLSLPIPTPLLTLNILTPWFDNIHFPLLPPTNLPISTLLSQIRLRRYTLVETQFPFNFIHEDISPKMPLSTTPCLPPSPKYLTQTLFLSLVPNWASRKCHNTLRLFSPSAKFCISICFQFWDFEWAQERIKTMLYSKFRETNKSSMYGIFKFGQFSRILHHTLP